MKNKKHIYIKYYIYIYISIFSINVFSKDIEINCLILSHFESIYSSAIFNKRERVFTNFVRIMIN